MRTMYDSVSAAAIPADATMVAGYVDGRYAWTPAEWARFPHAVKVQISINGSGNAGHVLDVEQGDATPAETEGWIGRRKASGIYRPTIYCSLSAVPSVRQGTGTYVLGKDYDLWVADYDGRPASVYTGSAATQYENTPGYDVSAVFDAAWPLLTAPGSTPAAPAAAVPDSWWPASVELRLGSTGNAVKVLQTHLHDSGKYGARGLTPIDGIDGSGTTTAVRNFQEDEGLTVDGIAGPKTRAALGVK